MSAGDFNLIVTTGRSMEEDVCSEVWFLLGMLGDRNSKVERTGISGIIVSRTSLDPFYVIKEFRRMLAKCPQQFRYVLRVIPIEAVVRTDLNEIKRSVDKLTFKIELADSFRVIVEKRHTNLSTHDIIENIVTGVSRKVDLGNPDKVILVEILGNVTALSIIEPSDVLSVVKELK